MNAPSQPAAGASITVSDVRAAAERIGSFVHRTPVLTSRLFNAAAGARSYFFKCENLQRGGSFKMRGASNFLLSLSSEQRAKGVVTFSSGNHGQAVAIAAEQLGVPATVVMPTDAPSAKVDSTRAHGARIVLYDRQRENREEIGAEIAEETGASIVPPFDHPWIIAGQGTAALELLEGHPDLDAIIVPVGGGGLLAGTTIAAKSVRPELKVFGVEPELANDWALSLEAAERVGIAPPPTIADGLRTQRPGAITFPIVKAMTDGVLLVSEAEIREAIRFLLTRMKLVAEPSGAVPVALALANRLPPGIRKIGVLVSGGNIDLDMLAGICSGDARSE